MSGLNVVKVKIYNLDGLTVFSTDPKQIGDDKSTNTGLLSAKNGIIASDITFRDQFDAFEQVINNRNLVSSYVPIRVNPGSPIEGVMEVYSDVTHYVIQLERTAWGVAVGVLSCLSLLYIFLFSIVRRADGIITAQREEMRLAHKEIVRHQSRHDPLTGLPNRLSFSEHLDNMIKASRRVDSKCALIYLGLDGFREIYDSMGYVARDQVLKEASARLKQCPRDADITARISGDEFAVGLSGISGEKGVERVVVLADRIRDAISSRPFVIEDHDFAVTTSIGIAIFPDNGNDVVELMKSANAALHHARSRGRNNYQFHTADMNARAFELLLLESDLRQALEENQFVLHYQ
ncbi:MAG TPA: GGDEF domain-containing protein, partial [Gammaproteobacteria bacterium]|nr:GGDEF domain-containing protein [Gammaproteobacteria bacterium]